MPRRFPSKYPLITSATALAAWAGVTLASVASAAPKTPMVPPTGKGVSLSGITEVLIWQQVFQPMNPVAPVVGDGAEWHIELVDADDKPVGTVDGYALGIYQRASDGHVIGWEDAKAEILDTTFHVLGPLDMTTGYTGEDWFSFTATGIKGRYKGWLGRWRYRVVPPTKGPALWQAELEVDIAKLD
jgi:hypothetical protein